MLKINKEMYENAKRVENLWKLSEENEYYSDIWCFNDAMFRKKYGNVDTLEVIKAYEKKESELVQC